MLVPQNIVMDLNNVMHDITFDKQDYTYQKVIECHYGLELCTSIL